MIGAAVGLGVVVTLARVYGERGSGKTWRGANARDRNGYELASDSRCGSDVCYRARGECAACEDGAGANLTIKVVVTNIPCRQKSDMDLRRILIASWRLFATIASGAVGYERAIFCTTKT